MRQDLLYSILTDEKLDSLEKLVLTIILFEVDDKADYINNNSIARLAACSVDSCKLCIRGLIIKNKLKIHESICNDLGWSSKYELLVGRTMEDIAQRESNKKHLNQLKRVLESGSRTHGLTRLEI